MRNTFLAVLALTASITTAASAQNFHNPGYYPRLAPQAWYGGRFAGVGTYAPYVYGGFAPPASNTSVVGTNFDGCYQLRQIETPNGPRLQQFFFCN